MSIKDQAIINGSVNIFNSKYKLLHAHTSNRQIILNFNSMIYLFIHKLSHNHFLTFLPLLSPELYTVLLYSLSCL